jgi:hypothetical protein
VFLKLEMEFGACSCVGREIGVSIYRCGSKTSRWTELSCVGPVEPSPGRFNRLVVRLTVSHAVRLADCRSNWSADPDTG